MISSQVKILIVEDELIIAHGIKKALVANGYQVEGMMETSDETINFLEQSSVDLVLMDIHIKGNHDGINTAIIVQEKFFTPVIFLTALSDSQTLNRAKKAAPYGYIVKPFKEADLKSNIEIALYKFQSEIEHRNEPEKEIHTSFFAKKGKGYVKVNFTDVLWIEAMENYVMINTSSEKLIIYSTFKNVEQKLPANDFVRVHRSYIVRMDKIEAIEEGTVLLSGKSIPVGKSYRENFEKRINFF